MGGAPACRSGPRGLGTRRDSPGRNRHNEFELQRLYETQLTAQVRNENLPHHDRIAAGAVLNACSRLLGTRLSPVDEHRTWVFSDPHFEHEPSVQIFGRPFRNCRHADSYLFEQWTHDVRDHDTVVCLGDLTMGPPRTA